ncbi:hypothetical protein BC829DRAFT_236686 [Chytridium lagenaria]|nr:hypothetical protein BC829DRAFT_236686 [Chytridium lagenaria]
MIEHIQRSELNNNKGCTALGHSHYVEAIALFSRAIFLHPQEPSFFVNRAEAFLKVVDFESAIANYQVAIDLIANNSSQQKESVWLNRRQRKVHFLWGQIFLDQRRYREALEQFEIAKGLGMAEDAVLARMAVTYIGMRKFDYALELLYVLTSRNPNHADLFILRAKIYRQQGNVDFVNIDTQRAIQLQPSHPEIRGLLEYTMLVAIRYKNKASDQILKGKFDVAIYFLNHALELDPMDWVLLFKRGILFSEIGQFESAIVDLTAVLEHPEYDKTRESEIRAHLGSVYNKLGVSLFQSGNFTESLTAFTTALSFNQSEPVVYKNRADCYLRFGEVEKTLKDLAKAWDIDPSDDEARSKIGDLRYGLAEKFLAMGDMSSATIELCKAIAAWPSDPKLYFERAKTYLLQQMIDAARSDLESALEINPGHREASALLMRLQTGPLLNNLLPFPPRKPLSKKPGKTDDTILPVLAINNQRGRLQESSTSESSSGSSHALVPVVSASDTKKERGQKPAVLTLVTPFLDFQ